MRAQRSRSKTKAISHFVEGSASWAGIFCGTHLIFEHFLVDTKVRVGVEVVILAAGHKDVVATMSAGDTNSSHQYSSINSIIFPKYLLLFISTHINIKTAL